MNKRKKFWKHYFIIVGIFLILILGFSIFFWCFLDSYEKGRPDYVINDVLKWYQNSDVSKINKYVIEDIYTDKIIKSKLDNFDGKYDYNKKAGLTDDLIYQIKNDSKLVSEVTLTLAKNKGFFNTARWNVKSIDLNLDVKSVNIVVPKNVSVFVNDEKLDNISDNNYYFDFLEDVKDYVQSYDLYVYDNYIDGMDIKLSNGNLEKYDDNNYYYSYEKDDNILNEVCDMLKNVCMNYTKYVVNETGFVSISSYILPNTNTYNFLKNIASTNKWSGYHDKTNFSDINFTNMKVFNDNVFSINVNYSYYFNTDEGRKDYDVNLLLTLVKTSNRWYIGSLITE